jgi:hypothetical protein
VGAMEEDVTPWALLIERLPAVPRNRLWRIEDEIKQLLADLAPLSPIFRDSHLLLLEKKTGLPLSTLVAACEKIANSAGEGDNQPDAGPAAKMAVPW